VTATTYARPDLRSGTVAAIALATVFLGAWAAIHFGFYAREQIVDIPVYEQYGEAMVDGEVPYRDFDVEYPPLALPVFAIPALGDRGYREQFEWLMAFCGCLMIAFSVLSTRALGLDGRALLVVALAPLLLGSVMLTRFDLWPAALTAGALAALLSDRLRLGHVVLGAAIAAKLYPAVLLPLAVAYAWRRRGPREGLVCLALSLIVVLATYLPFLAVAPIETVESIGRQISRPLQIESLGASVLLAAHQLFDVEIEMQSSHGSQNLVGDAATVVAVLLSVAQVATLVWLWVWFARGPATPRRFGACAAAVLVAFVALGKVLSPQFLIWLLPVVPLAWRLGANVLLAAVLVLTQLWFPFRYWDLVREFDPLTSWLVVARDFALVALLVVLIKATGDAREMLVRPQRQAARPGFARR
jgi:glycosyl transferase family 87